MSLSGSNITPCIKVDKPFVNCMFCVGSLLSYEVLGVLSSSHLAGKERAGCFTSTVAWLSLPYSVVDCSAVCDCGISWLYSFAF